MPDDTKPKKSQDQSTYGPTRSMGGYDSGGGSGGGMRTFGGIGGGMQGVRIPVGSSGSIGAGVGSGVIGGRGPVAGVGAKFRFAKGGKVSSASKRADGCATKGKTKGRFV